MEVEKIKRSLREKGIDGWLFYDFHDRDLIAYRILNLPLTKLTIRRWFYFIPASGEPIKLVHVVEPTKLDSLPGKKVTLSSLVRAPFFFKENLGKAKKNCYAIFSFSEYSMYLYC